MTQAPTKDKKEQEKEKDNFFLELLNNVLVQLPIIVVGWIISQFTSER
jgi:hypothetical protein